MSPEDWTDKLLAKWTADSNAFRSEARRLELVDRSRHATSIAVMEASADAIEKCVRDFRSELDL